MLNGPEAQSCNFTTTVTVSWDKKNLNMKKEITNFITGPVHGE